MADTTPQEQGIYLMVSFPRTPDMEFNNTYHATTHYDLVHKHWGPLGLKSLTIVEFAEDDPSGFYRQAIVEFGTKEQLQKAITTDIPELTKDVANFTNVTPVMWQGSVVKR